MSAPIAAGLLTAYFMLSIEVYLATYTIGTFHLSFWKVSPTELRILLAIRGKVNRRQYHLRLHIGRIHSFGSHRSNHALRRQRCTNR